MPLPAGHAAQHQRARPASIDGRRGRAARQAHLPRRARRSSTRSPAASSTASTATRPDYDDERGHRPRGGRRRAGSPSRRCTSTSPTAPGIETLQAYDLARLLAPAAREVSERAQPGARTSCARQLAHHNHRYYVLDDPEVGDDVYDALLDELRAIEARASRSSSRRTRRPSASAPSRSRGSRRSRHLQPMLSLANARSEEELRAWVARMRNHLAREGIEDPRFEYVAEPKIDGLAISLALPRRRARARRHARQRRGRRGRHAQPAHDPVDPAAHRRRAAADRGPRRGLHVAAGLRGAQRAPRRGRALDVHEPAQLGRRARSASSTRSSPPSARSRCGATRSAPTEGLAFESHWESLEWLRDARLPRQRRRQAARRPRTRSSRSAWPGRSAAARWTSRSTASS